MLRVFVIAILLLSNLILQSSLFQYIEIIGVKPNTSLLIILFYAMLRGDIEGAIVGFFSGLIQDIFFGKYIGLYALLGFVFGFFSGKPFKDFYRENYMIPLFFAAVFVMSYELVFYFTTFLFRGKVDFIYYFGKIILPETVYTAIVSIPVYIMMYAINSKIEGHEQLNRKLF